VLLPLFQHLAGVCLQRYTSTTEAFNFRFAIVKTVVLIVILRTAHF